jgi:hypothetical protein
MLSLATPIFLSSKFTIIGKEALKLTINSELNSQRTSKTHTLMRSERKEGTPLSM